MKIWETVKSLNNKILETLANGKEFTITSVTESSISVKAHSGKKTERTIPRKVIEGAFSQLKNNKKIDLEEVRAFIEFNPVYVLSILEKIDGVRKAKVGRKTILKYDSVHSNLQSNFSLAEEVLYEPESFFEGATKTILVNAYERSKSAREACIKKHKAICSVCSTDFSKVYGEIGMGFIHVHHIIPLSEVQSSYKVNGETDLIPVCPNCHSMLHRKQPPYTVKELKDIIEKQRK